MNPDVDEQRRWLIAGGAAILSGALSVKESGAQTSPPAQRSSGDGALDASGTAAADAPSAVTEALADYVTQSLDRELPADALVNSKMHVLDTIATIVFGSRLKPGEFAARYIDSLGGKPQATVIGTRIVTSTVNAALANGMMGHADETDDSHPSGFHPGVGVVPAALATAEHAGRTGKDLLRAVALGYDVGARLNASLGGGRHAPSCMTNTFAATAAAAALLRLNRRQVGHAFSFAGQQASGIGYWDRDLEHIEKAFDFGGMGARNGVTAATMVAMGATAVDDPFGGTPNVFTTLGNKPAPAELVAELGTRFEIINTSIKKWSVGSDLQSVLDSMAVLLKNSAVRPDNIKHVAVEMPAHDVHIFDNNPNPDLCVQHLVALMVIDGGATFRSINDVPRMRDPKILSVRKLVEVVPSDELQVAKPARQAIVRIDTVDGQSFSQRTVAVRGTPRNPMEMKEVEAKGLDLAGPVLGAARAKELVVALSQFDSFGPVSNLRRLLQA